MLDAKNNLISVIVPAYNVESYLPRCLQSIKNQTHKGFEVILVDDGSPDGCAAICDETALLDERYISVHQQNGGLSAARNTGIDLSMLSNSEWITFIDSDDWIDNDYLSLLSDAVINNNCDISIGEHIVTDNQENTEETACNNSCIINIEDYWVNNRTNATTAWGKLYKKQLFSEIRYPKGKYHEDEYVTYKLLFDSEKCAYVDKPIYYYFKNDESISRLNYLKRFPDIIEAFKIHYDYFLGSKFKKVFVLETEKYAETLSNALSFLKKEENIYGLDKKEIRNELRTFLKNHKQIMHFWKQKQTYISAYPLLKWIIRTVGYAVGKIKKD